MATAVDIVAVGIYVLIAALIAVTIGLLGDDPYAPDLGVYHLAAARIWADDVYLRLYPDMPFTYPPSALLLMAVLGSPLRFAQVLLYVVSVGSVWVTVRLTIRSAARAGSAWHRPAAVAGAATLALLSWPLMLGTSLGQVAPVVMGLAAIGTLGRPTRFSGVWVGTAAALKLTPAVFALYWWTVGRRRAALVAGAAFATWTALAWAVMPQSSWWYYPGRGLVSADQPYENLSNQSVMGVAARAGLDASTGLLAVVLVSTVLLAAALVVARRLYAVGWTAVAVTLVGVWSGIAAPVGWIHAFGWWVPLALAIGLTGRTGKDRLVAVLVYLVPFLLLVHYVNRSGPTHATAWIEGVFGANYLVLAVLVTGWLWWRVTGTRHPAAPT